MKQSPSLIDTGLPVFIALLATLFIALWVRSYFRTPALPERSFGMNRPASAPSSSASAPSSAGSSFYNDSVSVAGLPGSWPAFRGAKRDNVAVENITLAKSWSATGPPKLWTVATGEGYAAPVIQNGRVYLLDYDQGGQADALRCFSLADGTEIWRRSYPVTVKRNHGMSRTVPAVSGNYVVSLGPKCHVLCADATTGELRWMLDLVRDYGSTVPEWYAGQCPLIDENRVILAPGGKSLLMAVDLATGKPIWQTPNPRNWQMTHSSILPVTVGGVKMYIYCGSGGVAGVSAKDGSLLWETTDWTIDTATVPTPVDAGEGRIFLTGGYEAGSMLLQIRPEAGKYSVQTLFRVPAAIFGSDQQTPIFYLGHIYGVIPGGQLVCLDLKGQQVWSSGPQHRFGLGPYMIANGLIYLLNDTGKMTLAEATPAGYKPLATAQVMDGHECWGPMALAGGRLIVRDLKSMTCLDIAQK